jgi:hypothetical protein
MDTQNLLSMFLGYFIAGMVLFIIKKFDDDDPGSGMMIPTYNPGLIIKSMLNSVLYKDRVF